MTLTVDSETTYALGHSDRELQRLSAQAKLIDPITRRFFAEAGIEPGMRVLDVGSGAGDVALLLADMVGPDGEVVGADVSPKAISAARSRVEAAGITNISFDEGDPTEMIFLEPFDAVAGRYVLQFMQDPSAALAQLRAHLKPGGILVFHELDWSGARSEPPSPLYDRCCALCQETIARLGAETSMGLKLHAAFLKAGLSAPSMRLQSVIGSGPADIDKIHLVVDLMRTLLPDMQRLSIIMPHEINPETLAERMLAQTVSAGSVLIGRAEVGAWTRL